MRLPDGLPNPFTSCVTHTPAVLHNMEGRLAALQQLAAGIVQQKAAGSAAGSAPHALEAGMGILLELKAENRRLCAATQACKEATAACMQGMAAAATQREDLAYQRQWHAAQLHSLRSFTSSMADDDDALDSEQVGMHAPHARARAPPHRAPTQPAPRLRCSMARMVMRTSA